ncbi:MAG TPA: hypothetical protein VIP11_22085 [Gemmatimonadaceae bacterium]
MKLRFAAAVFGLAALVVGCWSEGLVFPLGAPPRAPVTTDSMTYTARVVVPPEGFASTHSSYAGPGASTASRTSRSA